MHEIPITDLTTDSDPVTDHPWQCGVQDTEIP